MREIRSTEAATIAESLIKPSRTRVVEKVDREVRIKDRVPKNPPYKRKPIKWDDEETNDE